MRASSSRLKWPRWLLCTKVVHNYSSWELIAERSTVEQQVVCLWSLAWWSRSRQSLRHSLHISFPLDAIGRSLTLHYASLGPHECVWNCRSISRPWLAGKGASQYTNGLLVDIVLQFEDTPPLDRILHCVKLPWNLFGCQCACSIWLLLYCSKAGILLFFIPPHSRHFVQVRFIFTLRTFHTVLYCEINFYSEARVQLVDLITSCTMIQWVKRVL